MSSTETMTCTSTLSIPLIEKESCCDSEDSWANRLNKIDVSLSRPLFRLGLPKWAEFLFSIPSNFCGTTAGLAIGPLWIALMAISQQQQEDHDNKSDEIRILLLQIITFSATAFYVTAWGCFKVTPCWYTSYGLARTIFWNPKLMILAYPCVVGILACTVPGQEGNDFYFDTEAKVIFSLAAYPLTLFPFVVLPLLYLKKNTQRSRPAPMDLAKRNESENWIQHKKIQAVTYLLARSCGDKCFPSADVAMAVLLAIPLWEIGGSCKGLAVAIVLLSGLERMYILAHYLSDVLAGGLITLGVHGAAIALGYEIYQTEWWHPLFAMGACVALLGGFKSIEF